MQLRPATDIKRLFSALGESPFDETTDLVRIDEQALVVDAPLASLEDLDIGVASISLSIALVAGWVAIKGYERNGQSLGWGLTWAALGWLMPVPALVVSAVKSD